MPSFVYKARNQNGKLVTGRLRAGSTDRAASLLRSHSLTPVSIEKSDEAPVWQRSIGGTSFRMRELILFFRQTAAMIVAGVPILETIQAMSKQSTRPSTKRILDDVAYDIESGDSLSNAMAKHDKVFNPFVLGVVRTGEVSGQLSDAFVAIADYLEQDYNFIRKVRAAFAYPGFVLLLVVVIVIILFTFVVPQLVDLFDDVGATLPLPTRILIAVSEFFQSYWLILLALIGILGGVFRSYMKTAEGRYTISTLVLRIPVLRTIMKKLYLSRLTSVLHMLFTSDVPALEALDLARAAVGNQVYRRVLADTVNAVKDGSSISNVWKHEPFIPEMLTSMVEVGERSGTVDKSFAEAGRFFQRDVEAMLETITVLLEPALIIILGLGVGIVVAAVLLPIYNLVLVF